MMHRRFYAAGDGGGEVILPEALEGQAVGQNISIEDDAFDYVSEGSPEAAEAAKAIQAEPEEFRGKSREDILGELSKAREAIAAGSKSSEPVSALQATMAEMLGQLKPKEAPVQPGYSSGLNAPQNRMSDADFEKYINDQMLENPYKAQVALQARIMEPLLQTMAVNQAQLSREVILSNSDSKKIYDKYASEIEATVAAVPLETRLRNPRIYQNALETVKARHMDDFVQESLSSKLDELLKVKLAEYGIDPSKPPVKAQSQPGYTPPVSTNGRTPASPTPKERIVVPGWIEKEASTKGIDKGFLYQHYKSKGLVK